MNKIDEFLSEYPSKKTSHSYRSYLNHFFRIINADPNTYFDEKRDYKQDVTVFWQHLMSDNRPPLSIKQKLMVIKLFLEENDIVIPKKTWKNFKRRVKGTRARTTDRVPTNKELKEILTHGNAMKRALFLMAASTGIRIDTLLRLELSDINMDSNPVKITIPGNITKSGNPRDCYMSDEARDALIEYLKVRDDYLKTAIARCKNKPRIKKSEDDNTIFPCGYFTAHSMWHTMIKKAGYEGVDKTTGRCKMHIHTLRKYFRTQMTYAGVPLDIVEALMGHEGYLTEVYRHHSSEQLGELYKKGMHAVTVFEGSQDISDIQEQLSEKDMQISNLERTMQELKAQVIEMRLEKIEKANGIKKK